MYSTHTEELLQAHGLRRTPGRIALLKTLAREKKPVTLEYLQHKLDSELDPTALYRALTAFEAAGIIIRYDFGHNHSHYELAHERPHHHHAVCTHCGKIEDIPAHDAPDLTTRALKSAPTFKTFIRHSLEFYGTCISCSS